VSLLKIISNEDEEEEEEEEKESGIGGKTR